MPIVHARTHERAKKKKWGHANLPVIYELDALEELQLGYTNLTSLPVGIGKLKQLKELNISQNPIKQFPSDFHHLTQLEKLEIESCMELECIPDRLEEMTKLRIINASRAPKRLVKQMKAKLPNCYISN